MHCYGSNELLWPYYIFILLQLVGIHQKIINATIFLPTFWSHLGHIRGSETTGITNIKIVNPERHSTKKF